MNIPKGKVIIPSPKLHNFISCETSAKATEEIWEIGVPEKNSLAWSILLSYLLSNESELNENLKKITGDDEEVKEVKKKLHLNLTPLNVEVIKQELESFNPFESKDAFFHQAKEVTEVFRIFDIRLKRYGNRLKKKNDEWNDDFKLNAASLFLECEIEVHFPDDTVSQKFILYPKSPHKYNTKIVLFQYENQRHGSRSEKINIFRFGMTTEQANLCKLNALNPFSGKAANSRESISKDTPKNKITITPPKMHDFTSCEASAKSTKVMWEVGVPEKNSLTWSVLLSYLYLSNESNFNENLKKITGDDEEVKEVKEKLNLNLKPLNAKVIKEQLESFNPFKNRHAFFHQAKDVIEVFRIFDLRLKRHGNSLKKKNDEWNDDFKLNAASLFLECEIEVHFPDDTASRKIVLYPKSPHKYNTKIVLFQYENQQHGSRLEKINIFRFGMTAEQANPHKLDALNHFLRKAKISRESISEVKDLMVDSRNHGKSFLSTILRNKCGDILQNIYRSPYIALKISEAGFETNPLACSTEKVSVFGQSVLLSKDSKFLSLMYDYASNCRCLFDHSVRRASDIVLKTLEKIKSSLEKDVLELSTDESLKTSDSFQTTLDILKQFVIYNEYQIKVASDLNDLKKNFESVTKEEQKPIIFKFRKSVIVSVLKHYETYFYYNLDNHSFDSMSISDKFLNYTHFSDYYKNIDNFGCISFFDNFYQLRLLIDLKKENVFFKN